MMVDMVGGVLPGLRLVVGGGDRVMDSSGKRVHHLHGFCMILL